MRSLPAPPSIVFAPASPVSVSFDDEPVRFSKPESVSLPSPVAMPVARFALTPLADVAKVTVSVPAPPISVSSPDPPSIVSLPAPPSITSAPPPPISTLAFPSPVMTSL